MFSQVRAGSTGVPFLDENGTFFPDCAVRALAVPTGKQANVLRFGLLCRLVVLANLGGPKHSTDTEAPARPHR